MKVALIICIVAAEYVWSEVVPTQTQTRNVNSRRIHSGGVPPLVRQVPNRSHQKKLTKKDGVPPYAVLMEPLVQYSQPDPLYKNEKLSEFKLVEASNNDLIHKSSILFETKDSKDDISRSDKHAGPIIERQFNVDSDFSGTHNVDWSSPGYASYFPQQHHHHEPPPEPPEPIIEIIIKESNESLPAPPPLPTPPPRKKKKEQVQVFYVKYSKQPDPEKYGEDKIVYESPIAAITPPTNQEEENEEPEAVEEEPGYPSAGGDEATAPPPPSTTLKAIIKPESETFHTSGGVRITFGEGSGPSGGDHHDLYGPGESESAPQPALAFPKRSKSSIDIQPVGAHSIQQSLKRHPGTVPQQQNFQPSPPLPLRQGPQQPIQQAPPPALNFHQPAQNFRQGVNQRAPNTFETRQPPPPAPAQQAYHTIPQPTFQNPPNRPFPPLSPFQTPFANQRPFPPLQPPPQEYHTINIPPRRSQQFQNRNSLPQQPPPQQQYQTINQPPFNQHQPQHFQNGGHRPPFHQTPPPPQPPPVHHFASTNHAPQQLPPNRQFLGHNAPPPSSPQAQHQHHQHIEQLNRLQQQQQQLQAQLHNQRIRLPPLQHNNIHSSTRNPLEIVKSVDRSEELLKSQRATQTQRPFTYSSSPVQSVQTQRPFTYSQTPVQTQRPVTYFQSSAQSVQTQRPFTYTSSPAQQSSRHTVTSPRTTQTIRRRTTTTTPEPTTTEDTRKIEEERKKKHELKQKQNEQALPDEVPEELRKELLSSGILGHADIQILDYDKIGDIPIESLPPEALANFQQIQGAGSDPVPSIVRPDDDLRPSASETKNIAFENVRKPLGSMEMKVVRFNPGTNEGSHVPDQYLRQDATQVPPVVLNDNKYNRYLPLKVSGAQFPVPDLPELRGRNVTSVVVLAPVDYEFLQRNQKKEERTGRSAADQVLEVQGVHFVAGDILKTLVKTPTAENYRKWLDKENNTSPDKQSVVLLVVESKKGDNRGEKEIYMYDVSSRKVNKLKGELSTTFVKVAESNSLNKDLDEISDDPKSGDFTIQGASSISPSTSPARILKPGRRRRKNT